jgi:CoA binding domain
MKDLGPLLKPQTIAVVGASEKFGAGSLVIENLRTLGFQGNIIPINPRYRELFGYPCYPSLAEVPSPFSWAMPKSTLFSKKRAGGGSAAPGPLPAVLPKPGPKEQNFRRS